MTENEETGVLTLHSPEDLLAAVPFLIGFHPQESVVALSLRDGRVGLTIRFDYPDTAEEELNDVASRLAYHLIEDHATDVLLVIYRDNHDSVLPFVELVAAALVVQNIYLRDTVFVSHQRWESLQGHDEECTGAIEQVAQTGHPMPDFQSSPVTAAHVLNGAPLPAASESAFAQVIAPIDTPESQQIAALCEPLRTDFLQALQDEEGKQKQAARNQRVRLAADAIDLLFTQYQTNRSIHPETAAIALVGMTDVHARDYAMGIHTEENLETANEFWIALIRLTPQGLVAPVGTVLAAVSFERGDGAMAQRALDRALEDRPGYPMASLLRKAMESGWPPSMMAQMRAELRADVVAAVRGAQ